MDAVGAASWLVQVVLEKLVGDGIDAAWAAASGGVDNDSDPCGDVRRLRGRLESLHLILSAAQEGAPRTRTRGEALLSSLRRLRNLASDADNLLDEMLYYQIHRQLHPDQASDASSSSSGSAVGSVVSLFRRAKRARLDGDGDTTGRIQEILEQMCEVGDDVREAIKMEKLDAFADTRRQNFSAYPRGQTTAYITEPKVFGRDTVKERIVGMLTSKEACEVNLSVLPIVGNGGVGKTTLAQLVYNDAVVQDHFSKRMWISVSVNFDEVRLTREMLDCLSIGVGRHDEITNLNKLQEMLEENVKSKRVLLVLDDLWENNDKSCWDKLLAPLRFGSLKGSVILVTSRNRSVVKMIATMDPIHLDGLEEDDFWLLFKSCVFGDEKYEGDRNLQIIGQGIAKKLQGYPLAAKSVGALLKRNLDSGHWIGILQSDEWKLQQGPDDIIPALKLSYIHLPFHLQRCFSYCALFPKGHRFDALDLVRIWISQGLIYSRNGRMEDTGHQYLNDLVDWGFFERSAHYSIHDLMHDLAQIVSSDECYMIDGFDSRNVTSFPTIRHLSINTRFAYKWNTDARKFNPNDEFQRKLAYIREAVHTRNLSTLMLFGKYDDGFSETFSQVFKDVHHLRVLRLPTLTYSMDFLLGNFNKLIHLRYLELICTGPGEPLPEVISQLYHLQVLDVECWLNLSSLPQGMNNLVNLRHFVAQGELHALIAGVGRLKFLQELKVFRVGKTTDFGIGQLNGLRELGGSLEIYNLENVRSKEESHSAGLRDKRYLQDLLLSWSNDRCAVTSITEAEVLEGLHPHSCLKRLHITGYGGISSPTWLSSNPSLVNLESISLGNCSKWEILPPLGQYPLLKTLHLIQLPASTELSSVPYNYCAGSEKQVLFPCLEELVVRDCPELRAFSLPQCSSNECFRSFGSLRNATIYNCPQLVNLPPFGHVKSLSKISIEGVGTFPHIRLFMKTLYIKGCDGPRTFDEILVLTECCLNVLEKLTIESCMDLAYLPYEIFSKLISLETLVLVDCPRLSLPLHSHNQDDGKCYFPSLLKNIVIRSCGITGKQLSHLLSQVHFLVCLTIAKCPKITSLEVSDLITETPGSSISDSHKWTADGLLQIPSATSSRLHYLCIDDFLDLVLYCREGFIGFMSLRTLHITGCPQLLSMMTGKEGSNYSCPLLPPSLQDLTVTHMHNNLLSFLLSDLTSLSIMAISRSPDLTSVDLNSCKSLETLIIEKCAGLSMLEGLQSLASLKNLRVFESPSLSINWEPSSAGDKTKGLDFQLPLEKLEIDNTSFFKACICKKLPLLQHIVFFMAKNVRAFTEEQDRALHYLTSLQVLDFCYCPDLQSLPKELHCLPSLKKLSIKACPGIKSLPEKGLPVSLQQLYVSKCSPELKVQCEKTTNVRCVYVDRQSKFITICKLLRLYFRNRKR